MGAVSRRQIVIVPSGIVVLYGQNVIAREVCLASSLLSISKPCHHEKLFFYMRFYTLLIFPARVQQLTLEKGISDWLVHATIPG
jgi:hypothetical protein